MPVLCITLLFKSGNQLFIFDRDGGNRTQLTSGAGYRFNASWSPDGKWIAFVRRGIGEPDDSVSIALIDPHSPENLKRVGKGYVPWWIDPEHLLVLQTLRGSGTARSVLYTVSTLAETETPPDSGMRFPLLHASDTLIFDWHAASVGWWLAKADGQGGRTRKLLLSPKEASGWWVSPSRRYLLYTGPDGGLWRLGIHDGTRTRLPKLFDGLISGECIPSYDDKEMVFVRSRIDSRLGLLENVFE